MPCALLAGLVLLLLALIVPGVVVWAVKVAGVVLLWGVASAATLIAYQRWG